MKKWIIGSTLAILFMIGGFLVSTKVIMKETKLVKSSNDNLYEQKLKKLGNIDKKISYFNKNYIDKYISYKEKNDSLSNEQVITHVNIGLDREFYTQTKKSSNLDSTYILVNKFNYLENDYVPKNLETIDTKYSLPDKVMTKQAKISFEFLAKKASEEGYRIRAVSTYRSYDYQNGLYENYSKKDGVEAADRYSARPGFSEHQTGLAVDVDNETSSYNNFEDTKEFKWMLDNSHKYGFILRYPEKKEYITGYMYEPWHFRFVGIEIATYIYENKITYEEYYTKFLEQQ